MPLRILIILLLILARPSTVEALVPVSYTHLDVYKRQSLNEVLKAFL